MLDGTNPFGTHNTEHRKAIEDDLRRVAALVLRQNKKTDGDR